jgi:hypothetical protein
MLLVYATVDETAARFLLDWRRVIGLHTLSSGGFMNRLVEIRSQEQICRERAAFDSERRIFWLAQAEEWEQRALDEIAYHFRECNLDHVESPALAN